MMNLIDLNLHFRKLQNFDNLDERLLIDSEAVICEESLQVLDHQGLYVGVFCFDYLKVN